MGSDLPGRPLGPGVRSDDARKQLEALRDGLVEDIGATEPKWRAPLYARLEVVLEKLGKLPGKESSARDDLAAKREERRKAAQASDGAGVQDGVRPGGRRPRR